MGQIRSLIERAPKKSKYKNHNIKIDGINFDSRGEGQRYLELKDMKKRKEIQDFELQPKYEIQPKFWKCCGEVSTNVASKHICPYCNKPMPMTREITYSADFKVTHNDGHKVIEDVKGKGGYTTPDFILKQKLFEYRYPGLKIEIVQRSGKGMEIFDENRN